MVSLPSNMFNTVTLPATLWFFDKSKTSSEKKHQVLFINGKNVFTQVDRTHRKFSDEQILNLGIITHLFDGDNAAFQNLVSYYKEKMKGSINQSYWKEQIDWLLERFPEGKYCDVTGLCKVATVDGEDGIEEQDFSLNPGLYVGSVVEDDGLTDEDYQKEISTLTDDIVNLNLESSKLVGLISENEKRLFKK